MAVNPFDEISASNSSTEVTYSSVSTLDSLNTTVVTTFIPPLIQTKPMLTTFYLFLLFTAFTFGIITNPITFIVHFKNTKLNKVGRIYLLNLCLADMCVNYISMPACAIGVIKGEEFFANRRQYCYFVSSACYLACVCAILNLTMASLNRYMFICHNQTCGMTLNRRKSLLLICLVWLTSLIFESFNMIGWGGHIYDHKQHSCVWNRVANQAYTLFVTIVLIFSPIFFISILNVLMLRKIQQTKMDICKLSDSHQIRGKRSWLAETLRTSRTIFFMFMVFIICWCPYVLVIALDPEDKIPEEAYLFVVLLAHLHSSSTFVVYWMCNKDFVKSVKMLLNISCSQSNRKQRMEVYDIMSSSNREFDKFASSQLSKQTSRTSVSSNTYSFPNDKSSQSIVSYTDRKQSNLSTPR